MNSATLQDQIKSLKERRDSLQTQAIEKKARLQSLRREFDTLKGESLEKFGVATAEELDKLVLDLEAKAETGLVTVGKALELYEQGNYAAALRVLGVEE